MLPSHALIASLLRGLPEPLDAAPLRFSNVRRSLRDTSKSELSVSSSEKFSTGIRSLWNPDIRRVNALKR